jgi:hypothetical protein
MERWLPLVLLAAVFLGLLGLRVAFLLILRRGERGPKNTKSSWPDATVIRTDPDDETIKP